MDKNIKKLISEAFSELYEEFMNEAPVQALRKTVISDNEIEGIIEKASRSGRGFSFEQTSNASSQENFNIIVDNLLNRYKENPAENIKAKEAVQNAFAPTPENRKLRTMLGKSFYGNDDLEDAMVEAYTTVLLRDFDKNLDVYRFDGGFGAQVIKLMRGRIHDYLYRKDGGDAYGSKSGRASLDSPAGEGRTLGDTFASEDFESDNGDVSTGREVLNNIVSWLKNHVGSSEFPGVNEKRMLATELILNGVPPSQIVKDYPDVFGNGKGNNSPTTMFMQVANSVAGQEISALVADIYKKQLGNFNLANINPNELAQTSAQSAEWSNFSKVDEKFTEEMKAIQDELFDSLKSLGFEPKDFNSDKKIQAIIDALEGREMESEASVIDSLFDDLNRAKEQAKSKGLYGAKTTPLPKSDKEEEMATDYGGMFEGISDEEADKLMERVLKRLSK